MYPCPPSQGWAALPSSCLPSQAQPQHHLISTIHLPEPSLHHLIKYFKTHLLICPGGKNPIPMLSSPKQKSTKDYLYQKCAARVSWPRSQILNFAPSLQGLSNMWLKTSPWNPGGWATDQEAARLYVVEVQKKKDDFWYLTTSLPASLPHRQQSWARKEVRQFHIVYFLPTQASFHCCMSTSNTGTRQDNCKCPSVY